MLHQIDIYGKDKVETAIERIQDFAKMFPDDEGYYLAFSGGKDSVVIKKLADLAGVKYDAHYAITSVDPPELVRFIKREYPDVKRECQYWDKDGIYVKKGDPITMWNLIPEKSMPPTRLARYCCQYLKESNGDGRLTMTGVRWAESPNRKKNQGMITVYGKSKKFVKELEERDVDFMRTDRGGVVLNQDNDETREAIEFCYKRRKTVLNPIIDWEDEDVWEFIHEYNVPYCDLYDKGYKRLGCIGCPMNTAAAELEKYPKYKEAYKRAFGRMLDNGAEYKKWRTVEDVYNWWLKIEEV